MRSRVHFRPTAIGRSAVSARAVTRKLPRDEATTETTQAFLQRLSRQARSHRAVHHPYLRALACGDLPDSRWALKDFARHYHGYSAYFPHYLRSTIGQLSVAKHREALSENLAEESGQYPAEDLRALRQAGIAPEWIVGVRHPELFQRFVGALGVEPVDADATAVEVICWREMFLGVLAEGSPAQSVGALGLGTEGVVSTMYRYFLPALKRLALAPKDTVFFPLHTMVDDHHQATLLDIAGYYARSAEGRHEVEKGMSKALYLRAGFWDWLYTRALESRRPRGGREAS